MGQDINHINFYGLFVDESDLPFDVDFIVYTSGSIYDLNGISPVVVLPADNECWAVAYRKYTYTSGQYPNIRDDYQGEPSPAEREEFEVICRSLGFTDVSQARRNENSWVTY